MRTTLLFASRFDSINALPYFIVGANDVHDEEASADTDRLHRSHPAMCDRCGEKYATPPTRVRASCQQDECSPAESDSRDSSDR